MQAGDDSAAAVAARINVTYPGLATTKDGGKRLRLEHATRVRVTADPAFDMIGLPIEDRDVAALASESYVVPIVFAFDRFAEVCSSAIEIPIEANRIGLWVGVEGRDTTTHNRWGIQFHAMWSNGDEGEPPYTTAIGTNETIADPSPIYPSGDEAVGAITLLHSNSFILVGSVEGFKFVRYMEYEVPIGAKRMRLFTTGAASTEANPYTTTNPPPLIAPALSCAAFVGVRS
jgi:hypothetical protein